VFGNEIGGIVEQPANLEQGGRTWLRRWVTLAVSGFALSSAPAAALVDLAI
jgi:hypothetical protein